MYCFTYRRYAVIVVTTVVSVLAAELADGTRAVVFIREVVAVGIAVALFTGQRAAARELRVPGRLADAPEAAVRAVSAAVDFVGAIHAVRVAVAHLEQLDARVALVRHGEDAAIAEELVV